MVTQSEIADCEMSPAPLVALSQVPTLGAPLDNGTLVDGAVLATRTEALPTQPSVPYLLHLSLHIDIDRDGLQRALLCVGHELLDGSS